MKSSTNKIILTSVIIAGLTLLLMFLAVRPLLSGVEKVQGQINQSENRLARLGEEIESYQTAIEELRRVREGREEIEDMFPVREDMVGLIQSLEDSLRTSGTAWDMNIEDKETPGYGKELFERSSPADKRTPLVKGVKNLKEVPYQLSVTGSFRQLTDFMLRYDHLPFVTEVEKMTVNAETQQSEAAGTLLNTGQATAQIDAIFFIKDK